MEDDSDLSNAIAEFLVGSGIEPILCTDGAAALEVLRSGGPLPDLILLDLTLPKTSGQEVMSQLACDERLSAIPVAAMSGYPASRYAYLPPVEAFLEKPFDLEELNAALSKLCSEAAASA